MVEDLVCGFVPGEWIEALDFTTLCRTNRGIAPTTQTNPEYPLIPEDSMIHARGISKGIRMEFSPDEWRISVFRRYFPAWNDAKDIDRIWISNFIAGATHGSSHRETCFDVATGHSSPHSSSPLRSAGAQEVAARCRGLGCGAPGMLPGAGRLPVRGRRRTRAPRITDRQFAQGEDPVERRGRARMIRDARFIASPDALGRPRLRDRPGSVRFAARRG